MMSGLARDQLQRILADTSGIIPLEPAWVTRDWLPPGRRLGLDDAAYDLGERGFICERWLGSTTHASNRIVVADEGLSYARTEHDRMLLTDMIAADPAAIMGPEYAATHTGLSRLAKIFDYGARIPYHIHPRKEHAALVGRNPKDEAYYFPEGVELGEHPETFFGVHPWIVDSGSHDVLLPYLVEWNSDLILQHSRGYVQVAGDGWHVPAGILHAPGTALTVELQEDSDAMLMLQPRTPPPLAAAVGMASESSCNSTVRAIRRVDDPHPAHASRRRLPGRSPGRAGGSGRCGTRPVQDSAQWLPASQSGRVAPTLGVLARFHALGEVVSLVASGSVPQELRGP